MSGVVQLASQVFHVNNFPHQLFSEVAESKIFLLHSTPKHALLQAASASSAADYYGQWVDAKTKQKRRRIAGIDQDELLDPTLLADPDSCFCEFKGVTIHHKVCDADPQAHNPLENQAPSQLANQTKIIGFPMILLHGFGASVFSWNRVMKPLAQVTGSKVLAFDRPAFGLTSRVNFLEQSSPSYQDTRPLNPYSMAFSVLATLGFIDLLAADKAILVGHSAGSIVAVNSYFEAPERVAALILVAPAILAPLSVCKVTKGNRLLKNPFIRVCKILSKFSKYIVRAIAQMMKRTANMLNSLYKKALSAILRSAFAVMLVRMIIDRFGIAAIRNAWHDSSQITDHVLYGYTKPLRTKGWDRALVEYTAAMLTDSTSESKLPLVKRLDEISCPVLIITGDNDRLVPSWNAERLSRAIPGSCFEVIKHCGHLPHEERVEEFLTIVEKFLQKVFSGPEKQGMQGAS
ncbi:unnamed protein product, partial [Vitis vinifera]